MDDFDDWLNDLSDDDALWGPLVFLRPEPTARLTPQRILALSLLHGLLWGMGGNLWFVVVAHLHETRVPPLLVLPLVYVMVIYVSVASSLALAWNRRAGRLARKAELTPRAPSVPASQDD